MKLSNQGNLWFGTDDSFQVLAKAEKTLQDPMGVQNLMALRNSDDSDEEETSRNHLLTKQGNVSVITIAGSLAMGGEWYYKYLGLVGYDEIREAVIEAVQDTSTDSILLDISSGGGAAMGVNDLGEFLMDVDASHKPIIGYTSSVMASAAYWIGASARQVYSSKSAIVGSIGVIAVHRDMTGALEQAGIKATVVRAGKFKALGTPFEKMEGEALEAWQSRVSTLYDFFLEHVAAARGSNKTTVDAFMAQGREFFGEAAYEADLVDGNISFDALMKKMTEGIDFSAASNKYANNLITGQPMKKARRTIIAQAAAQTVAASTETIALTEEQIAAIAEGAHADINLEVTAAVEAPEADVQVEGQETETDEQASIEVAAPVADNTAEMEKIQAVVDYLKGENASLNAELASARARLQAENTRVDQLNAEIAGLRGIAEASVSRLQVALKMGRDVAEMSTEALLATHDNLRKQFETQFKAGGVAAVATTEHRESPGEAVSSVRAARLSATRLNK